MFTKTAFIAAAVNAAVTCYAKRLLDESQCYNSGAISQVGNPTVNVDLSNLPVEPEAMTLAFGYGHRFNTLKAVCG